MYFEACKPILYSSLFSHTYSYLLRIRPFNKCNSHKKVRWQVCFQLFRTCHTLSHISDTSVLINGRVMFCHVIHEAHKIRVTDRMTSLSCAPVTMFHAQKYHSVNNSQLNGVKRKMLILGCVNLLWEQQSVVSYQWYS